MRVMDSTSNHENHNNAVNLKTTPRGFVTKLKSGVKEMFFPNDLFRHLKNEEKPLRRVLKGVQYFIPILEWLPNYTWSLFCSDFIAGLTITSLTIPQGINYAKLAYLPPIIGLYSSFVPAILYAIFGTSRHMAVGTVASSSILIYQTISKVAKPEDDPKLYLHLVFTTTLVAGAFQACLGILRLGTIVNFLSRSAITGFIGGSAIMLSLHQLQSIFGMKHVVSSKTDLITVLNNIWTYRHEIRLETTVLGLIIIIFLQFTRYVEGITVGRNFAEVDNSSYVENKEMIAFGLMNLCGSFTSCYLTTGPFSKTAMNYNAGCKTAMSNIVQAFLMAFTLQFLAPLFYYTPLFALSAITVSTMLGLINYTEAINLYKVDKFDFIICIAAFLGVIFGALDVGLMLSVGLGVLRALLYVARPTICTLGMLPDLGIYRDVKQYIASTFPGVMIVQLGSPIFFANYTYIRERIMSYVRSEQDSNGGIIEHIILDMSGVTSIDTTAIQGLLETNKIFEMNGMKMSIVNPRMDVLEKLIVSRFVDKIGKKSFFLTLDDAVKASNLLTL
ncbi:hypothetical protein TanjilG_32771 [Lupinus angustifolius]|uniref:STAS domain-containing protein n=1 Tax=Lupinus angustifolius TaxID=3871 RepID=A0A4P1RFH8_LUPAN|nr:PREDICTED: probable sulfate transporter 3.5 isoform X2 [Lupinus angustifolius]OIW10031.1 hypothetical protein TanjilG_32771 [Lupinus angustifolius]